MLQFSTTKINIPYVLVYQGGDNNADWSNPDNNNPDTIYKL